MYPILSYPNHGQGHYKKPGSLQISGGGGAARGSYSVGIPLPRTLAIRHCKMSRLYGPYLDRGESRILKPGGGGGGLAYR